MGKLTTTGYQRYTYEEFLTRIFTAWRGIPALGSTFLDTNDTPQFGLAAPVAELMAEIDEGVAAMYGTISRSAAVGTQLDHIGDLIGVSRKQATPSTVTLTLSLNSGSVVEQGSQVARSTDPTQIYATDARVENTTGSAADFTVTATAVTAGTGTYATAGQLTSIVTPMSGWTAVTNAADAVPGTDRETDAAYRASQVAALALAGSGTLAAMKSAVLAVSGVTAVDVLNNTTDFTDADSVPPHSFEVLVLGGDDDDIAQVIFDNQPLGIQAHGVASGTATDGLGTDYTVYFFRPTEISIDIEVTVTTSALYPGDAALKEAIVAACEAQFTLGDDVEYTRIFGYTYSVAGVDNVSLVRIRVTGGSFAEADIAIGRKELAAFDTARVTVLWV